MLLRFFMNRLVFFPLIFTFIWSIIFMKYPDIFIIEVAKDGLRYIPFHISETIYFVGFGYVFGYIYSTISIVIKLRTFRGILFVVLAFLKIFFSIVVTVSFGYFLLIIEIALLPVILLALKRRKIKKEELQLEKTKSDKEELINEIKKIMKENNIKAE